MTTTPAIGGSGHFPSRRQFLAATTGLGVTLLAGCLAGNAPAAAPNPTANPADPVGAPAPNAPGGATADGIYGEYRGQTTVEALRNGERASVTYPVAVTVGTPKQYGGVRETNPFHLSIVGNTALTDSSIPEYTYSLWSAGVYQDPDTWEQWFEQHWDITETNGQLRGTLTNHGVLPGGWIWLNNTTNISAVGPTTIPYMSDVHMGASLAGTVGGGRFDATIDGQTNSLEAFRITVTADRPRL